MARSSGGESCPATRAPGFDTEVEIDAGAISPMVTWGTTPVVTGTTGAAPQVTIGEIAAASISTSVSKPAPSSLGSSRHRSTAHRNRPVLPGGRARTRR